MDPVKTAIMGNRFMAIVEEASAILHRTAHTTFVKLVQDYQCALATAEGEIFAYPQQSGVNAYVGLPLHAVIEHILKTGTEAGDCFIMNDPFSTEGVVNHLMDVTMIWPIFAASKLVAFGWTFVHASDIGGAIPGSISPAFSEIFQEGLRMRPVKLYQAGVLNADIRNIFLDNSRIPTEMWGDFQAMFSALRSMDIRIRELCERFGAETVTSAMQDLLSFSESKARDVLRAIPDGRYSFSDYLEGIDGQHPTHIRTTVEVRGDDISVDFTGTDPQIPAAYNVVSGSRAHPYILQALLSFITTADPTIPRNAGLYRPIRLNAPQGTIVNAVFPASGGSRVATGARSFDTILACLNQMLPDGLAAAGSGSVGIIVLAAKDPRTGKRRVSVINPIIGGSGGRSGADGVDGVDIRYGALKSVPTEMIEIETVMRLRRYAIMPDSQSPGKWRGGAAIVMELENTADEATLTVRGMNRFKFRPWGARGGKPGQLARITLNPGRADERAIGKITVLQLRRGDVVQIVTPSGGGFGDPLERPLDLVVEDLRFGVISREAASRDYGVVVDAQMKVDLAATAAARAARRSSRPAAMFSLGEEREEYDRAFSPEARARLAEAAIAQRESSHGFLSALLEKLSAEGGPVTLASAERELESLRRTQDTGSPVNSNQPAEGAMT